MNPRPDTDDIVQTISDKADRMETKAKRATDELADKAERGVDRAREMANDTLGMRPSTSGASVGDDTVSWTRDRRTGDVGMIPPWSASITARGARTRPGW